MNTGDSNTEKLLNEVLEEVRGLRQAIEADNKDFDSLDRYEHPDRIVTSLEEAKKQYGEPKQ